MLTVFSGITIGAMEIFLYLFVSSILYCCNKSRFNNISKVTYFWSLMTVLTGIWESFYVTHYDMITNYASQLLKNKEHVWTSDYDLTYVLPNKLSYIFYAEYGAYADREYMTLRNDWSRVIESTHAIFCGFFSMLAIHNKLKGNERKYNVNMSIAMGSQLMNSILYMANYFIETRNPNNINYNTTDFPTGYMLLDRPFMWVNLFWLFMPTYVIFDLLG